MDLTAAWEQVLDGTLAYLRAQMATDLDYPAAMRVERAAWARAQQILAELGMADLDRAQETDELLDHAVSPTTRQAVTEQVLGAAAGGAPDDEGPEGVADVANREMSDEVSAEVSAADEPEPLDEVEVYEDELEPAPTVEEAVDVEALAADPVLDEPEFEDDEPTAAPGTQTPLAPARTEEPVTVEEELDLDDIMEELPATAADSEDEELDLGEPEGAEAEARGPLLPDFDFDDDDQDETVVFSIGGGDAEAGLGQLAAASRDTADDVEDEGESFDLMPDLEAEEPEDLELDDDDLELEEIEVEEETIAADDQPDPAPLGAGASVSVRASQASARAAAQVAAGLYGNRNVPTIREERQPPPRAAAIKINPKGGTGKVMGFEEEEEPLEIGAAEDYGEEIEEDEEGGGFGGFSLSLQEDEYEDDEWEDEEPEEEEEPEPAAPVYTGPDPAQIAAMLAKAREAAERGDMHRGVELFSDVLDADPDVVDAYVGRGRLYLDLGDYSRAMSDFITAEDLEPNNPEPQVAIGDLYFARKDYRKAIDYFTGALELDANHAMAHCRRGISYYYRKKYAEALVDLQAAEKLDPEIPNIGTYISMARKKSKK